MAKKILGVVVLSVFIFSAGVSSATVSPYGPKGKRIGAGIVAGEPTGVTVKGYLTQQLAINGIAAWSFDKSAFTVIGDVIYDFFDIPADTDVVKIPFYVGAGAKIAFKSKRTNRPDGTTGGVRIPIGVGFQWVQHPIEAFVEIGPGIQIAPSTTFDLTGGVGARFYF